MPDVRDPLTAPFWAGLRERRLLVQRCTECATPRYPAAPVCPSCLTAGGEWSEIPGEGELYSYVVYHRALSPAFAADVPYAVGIVELPDRIQIVSRIDAPPESVSVGVRMRARYVDVTPEVTLLHWEPVVRGGGEHRG
ncbi:hypothetical protein PZ61_0235955 [Streptomyces sp. MNU77]|nr:hypothetical protein PZ61_0235955 [Streptomyces sp. MNU77]